MDDETAKKNYGDNCEKHTEGMRNAMAVEACLQNILDRAKIDSADAHVVTCLRSDLTRLVKQLRRERKDESTPDGTTYTERINKLALDTVAIWPTARGEFRVLRGAAIRAIKDTLYKVARQEAYERRDEIEKLKRKLCIYETMVGELQYDGLDGRGRPLVATLQAQLKSVDDEPVATLE